MKLYSFLAIAIFSSFLINAQYKVALETFTSGLDKPVSIKNAGDTRLFVVEQDGLIQVVNSDGSKNTIPFLDIQDRVGDIGGIGDERGLLGLAFHPDYESNGFFYVNYINNSGDTEISRFSVSNTNVNIADASSELPLLSIDQPFGNHNGGDLAFGSDGFLYISSGDGGDSGDPGDRAQSLNTLLGKILRIDVNNASGGNNYAIPSTNPFINTTNALDEIWAYGLRNAWKFSFDRANNDLWIADVGQRNFEEINNINMNDSGLNLGWRCYEGNEIFNDTDCPNTSTLTSPVAVYEHTSAPRRCSITGGYRYRGTQYPGFSGLYFFADYCSNEIGTLENNNGNWELSFSESFSGNNWSAFGEAIDGELYIAGISSGVLYKLVDSNLSIDTESTHGFDIYPNPTQEVVFVNANIDIDTAIIFDLNGRKLGNIDVGGKNFFELNIKNFNVGLYVITITDEFGNKFYKKLLKN